MNISISRQLLFGVVASSTLITGFMTVLQLFKDYEYKKEITYDQFDTLMYTNQKALETSIWDININQIESVISGLKSFPGVDHIELEFESVEGKTLKALGEKPKEKLVKSYDLSFSDKKIGAITLSSSKQHVYNHLWDRFISILISNMVKTFLASMLILYVINNLLTKHLIKISNFLKDTDIKSSKKLTIDRSKKIVGKDELYQLAHTINSLLKVVNDSTHQLEDTVAERTKELVEEKKKVELAYNAKGRFLANMSHEIRTPMNGILGFAGILKNSLNSPEELKYLKSIERSGEILLELINDILDISKIEAGKLELEYIPYDLVETTNEIIDILRLNIDPSLVNIEILIGDNFPKIIVGDPVRIRQILINIVGNAIKFTKQGTIEISLNHNTIEKDLQSIEISVKDSGIGIPVDLQEKLFSPFAQADSSTTRQYGGTGLGLSICKGIVDQMNGKIWVESKMNQGAKFIIQFAANTSNLVPTNVAKIGLTENEESIEKSLKILVAEDNTINQDLIKSYFKKMKLAVDMVSNGKEVLEIVKNNTYDLILMDCHMPEMDGYEATEEIIKLYGNNKPYIVALTASNLKEDRIKCQKAGMDEFMSKPLRLKDLKNLISSINQKFKSAS